MGLGGRRESVGRGSQSDYRFSCFEKAVDGGHLVIRKPAPASQDDHQVRAVEGVGPGDVGVDVRVDDAGFGVNCEKHGGFKTVMGGEDLGELRQAFF